MKAEKFTLRQISLMFGIAVVTLLVYLQVLDHQFIDYDDKGVLLSSPQIFSGFHFDHALWAFTSLFDGNYIPINWISHMLVFHWVGFHAGSHVLVNVFLHILNSMIVLTFFKRLTGDFKKSFYIALIFALHPLHVESVAWLSSRKDLLSGFFALLTMIAHQCYVTEKKNHFYYLSLFCFLLALLSKPVVVVLPVFLLLLDAWPLRRFELEDKKSLFVEKIPFFLLSLGCFFLTFMAHDTKGWLVTQETISIGLRTANAALSYVKYLIKMILPVNLAVFYPYESVINLIWKGCLSGLLLASLTWWVIKQKSKRPYLAFGWFWFLVGLLPVIKIVSFAGFSMADRFMYLPMMGLLVMLVWGLPELMRTLEVRKWISMSALAVLLGLMSFVTYDYVSHWKNTGTLFSRTAQVTRNNFIAHIQIGMYEAAKNNFDKAEKHLLTAIAIRPDPATINNLGSIYYRQGKFRKALNAYQVNAKQYPDFKLGWMNLGLTYKKLGRFREAGDTFAEAVKRDSGNIQAYYHLSESLMIQKRDQEAIYLIDRVLKMDPDSVELQRLRDIAIERLRKKATPPPVS